MIPEKAYALAQSAGWVGIDLPAPSMFKWSEKRYEENYKRACDALTALDPTFFQALGKALGWKDSPFQEGNAPWWHFKAHLFYDLILTGGDTEKFWEEILK